ncbi:14734_t:CDS:2, partial [Acaulospora colombiana]
KHSSRKEDKLIGPSGWKHYDDENLKATEDMELGKAKESDEPAYVKGYYVDKKGDPLNITYGGLHKGDIPKFHRAGRGQVLGLSSSWNIKRGSGLREVEGIALRIGPIEVIPTGISIYLEALVSKWWLWWQPTLQREFDSDHIPHWPFKEVPSKRAANPEMRGSTSHERKSIDGEMNVNGHISDDPDLALHPGRDIPKGVNIPPERRTS